MTSLGLFNIKNPINSNAFENKLDEVAEKIGELESESIGEVESQSLTGTNKDFTGMTTFNRNEQLISFGNSKNSVSNSTNRQNNSLNEGKLNETDGSSKIQRTDEIKIRADNILNTTANIKSVTQSLSPDLAEIKELEGIITDDNSADVTPKVDKKE